MGWDSPDQRYSYLETLADTDADGVPDAFEKRRTITEILNAEEADTVIVELEGPRLPRKGEVFITTGAFLRSSIDHPAGFVEFYIVKRFVSGSPVIVDA